MIPSLLFLASEVIFQGMSEYSVLPQHAEIYNTIKGVQNEKERQKNSRRNILRDPAFIITNFLLPKHGCNIKKRNGKRSTDQSATEWKRERFSKQPNKFGITANQTQFIRDKPKHRKGKIRGADSLLYGARGISASTACKAQRRSIH